MGMAEGGRKQQHVVEQVAFHGDLAPTRTGPESRNDARQGYVSESSLCREASQLKPLLTPFE